MAKLRIEWSYEDGDNKSSGVHEQSCTHAEDINLEPVLSYVAGGEAVNPTIRPAPAAQPASRIPDPMTAYMDDIKGLI